MTIIEKASELKNNLDALRPLDKGVEDRVLQKLRLEWNYHSNKIEGNSLTYGETKALILFGITAQGKPLKDHFEVTGHDEAIKWVTDITKAERKLNETFIKQLHQLLLKESYTVDAITPDGKSTKKKVTVGQYKSSPNHVQTSTGEIFRFAEPEETPAKMHDLLQWYNQSTDRINPIIKAAEFHYRFILIHPFDDGNGRTARILMNFILLANGYPPVVIKNTEKEEYYRVLRLADADELEPFIEFIATNLVDSLNLMISAANGEDISELDDIDKEVALLERKFMNSNQTISVFKSKEVVKDLLLNGLGDLINRYFERSKMFDNFYLKVNRSISIEEKGNTHSLGSDALEDIRKLISDDIDSIIARISHLNIKTKTNGENIFRSSLKIKFNNAHIDIFTTSLEKPIEKLYSEKLSIKEIDEIINTELARHKAFIEQFI